MESLVRSLIAAAEAIPTVDPRQHLGPEAPGQTDLCQVLIRDNYLLTNLAAAGLAPGVAQRLAGPGVPLRDRWQQLRPFWLQGRRAWFSEDPRRLYRL